MLFNDRKMYLLRKSQERLSMFVCDTCIGTFTASKKEAAKQSKKQSGLMAG